MAMMPTPAGIDEKTIARLRCRIATAGERDQIAVPAPFTGETIGTIPRGTEDDVALAVDRARRAQPAWAARSYRERGCVLRRFSDLVLAHRDELLDLVQLETGKARKHALEEVLDTAIVARHYAVHGARYLRPRLHRVALPLLTTAREYRHPVGVVGVISPWNFPLILGITDLLPALMAGNAVVLRPDVHGSFTALRAAELLAEAGLPEDALVVVTGRGAEVGPPLIDRADFVMFTGSTATGKRVARQAAERLIGYALDLSGKNPMIVLADADVEKAVDGAIRGAFAGAGQVCVSIERIYVHASLYDRFAARLVERVRAMRLSAALDWGADMGSLTVPEQMATVERHVADAVAKGAIVLAGGRARPDIGPLFYEPTVLAGATAEMALFTAETFGPVVALYSFATEDEAISRANDSPFGLNASVWSKSVRRAVRLARRVQCGMVNINEPYGATWTATGAPIGGMKESGFGRRHGAEGIRKFTEAQVVAAERFLPLAPPPFLSERAYARLMPFLVRLLGRIPWLR